MTGDVVVTDFTKRYGSVVAVDDVSLTLSSGSVHVLAGPNGSGKTTLLRAIADLTRPSAGTVSTPDVALGYAFQRPNLYPDLTVAGNLDVFDRMVDADPQWRASLVSRLRLDAVAHRRAGDLSDGFAKKLDLALALLKEPSVLLLDEPLADIDDATERRLLDLLADYRRPDRTIVLTSHNLRAVGDLCDRLVVLFDGSVVLDQRPAETGTTAHAAYAAVLDERL
ncbi:MAG: ATP-binding cassette domain-containing protein [Halobacteriaceae archaeon]